MQRAVFHAPPTRMRVYAKANADMSAQIFQHAWIRNNSHWFRLLIWWPIGDETFHKNKDSAYKQLSTSAKENFKINWAFNLYDTLVQTRTKTDEMEESDWAKGTYQPFDMVVSNEGGFSDENLLASKKYCSACVEKGGKWIRWNDMSQRLEYFYVKHGHTQSSRQKWTLQREEGKRTAMDDAQKPDGTMVKAENHENKKTVKQEVATDTEPEKASTRKSAQEKKKASPKPTKTHGPLTINMTKAQNTNKNLDRCTIEGATNI